MDPEDNIEECEWGCEGTGTIETEDGYHDCVCEIERKAAAQIDADQGK